MIKAGIVCSEKRDYTPCHKGCTYTGKKSLAPLSSLWWITWTSPGCLLYTYWGHSGLLSKNQHSGSELYKALVSKILSSGGRLL